MPKTLKWGQEYSVLLDVGAVADAFTLDSSHLTAQMCLTARQTLWTQPNMC
jgi:hypothetical protein